MILEYYLPLNNNIHLLSIFLNKTRSTQPSSFRVESTPLSRASSPEIIQFHLPTAVDRERRNTPSRFREMERVNSQRILPVNSSQGILVSSTQRQRRKGGPRGRVPSGNSELRECNLIHKLRSRDEAPSRSPAAVVFTLFRQAFKRISRDDAGTLCRTRAINVELDPRVPFSRDVRRAFTTKRTNFELNFHPPSACFAILSSLSFSTFLSLLLMKTSLCR